MTKTIITSASDASVSIFDMVANTATQTTKLVNAVGKSVNMFDRFMTDSEERQIARSKVSMHTFYKELAEDSAREISLRQREIQTELAADPQYAALYEENYKELEAILQKLTSEE